MSDTLWLFFFVFSGLQQRKKKKSICIDFIILHWKQPIITRLLSFVFEELYKFWKKKTNKQQQQNENPHDLILM